MKAGVPESSSDESRGLQFDKTTGAVGTRRDTWNQITNSPKCILKFSRYGEAKRKTANADLFAGRPSLVPTREELARMSGPSARGGVGEE